MVALCKCPRSRIIFFTTDLLLPCSQELDLPWLDKPWYRFDVLLIGPHLPPANAARGFTPDMCIPIYPNARHPTIRAPLHTETPFPFSNCYHWIENNIHVLVRSRPEGFDETNAIQISGKTEGSMGRTFTDDYLRAMKNRELESQSTRTGNKLDVQERDPPARAHSCADTATARSQTGMDVPHEHWRVSIVMGHQREDSIEGSYKNENYDTAWVWEYQIFIGAKPGKPSAMPQQASAITEQAAPSHGRALLPTVSRRARPPLPTASAPFLQSLSGARGCYEE